MTIHYFLHKLEIHHAANEVFLYWLSYPYQAQLIDLGLPVSAFCSTDEERNSTHSLVKNLRTRDPSCANLFFKNF